MMNEAVHKRTDGTHIVVPVASDAQGRVLQSPGVASTVDTRFARFNAAADLPTDPTSTSLVQADLVRFDTFAAGKRNVRVRFHHDPFANLVAGAFVTINAGDDVTAASRLTLADVSGGQVGSTDQRKFMVSLSAPEVEFELDTDVVDVYLVGVVSGAATPNVGNDLVSVEVW